jgi:hypothetical protein
LLSPAAEGRSGTVRLIAAFRPATLNPSRMLHKWFNVRFAPNATELVRSSEMTRQQKTRTFAAQRF